MKFWFRWNNKKFYIELKEKSMFKTKIGIDKILIIVLFINILYIQLYGQESKTDDDHFYFVQISDTHIGKGTNLEITQRLVKQINELPMNIRFVIHTGDITQNGMSDTISVLNAIEALEKLAAPIYYIPGNHDIFQKNLEKEINIFQEYFGKLIFIRKFKEVSFIGLYSDPLAYSFSVEGYDVFNKLENALKKTYGKPVVVFHHIPSVEFFYNNTMHDGWDNENRDRWEKTLNSYNVIAILAGHFHSDEQHWIGEIPLYVSASVTNRFGRQPSFRIYEYKNGKLSYRTQYEK